MNLIPVIFSIGFLIFLAHLFTGIFRKTRVPDVLLLIIIGLLLGPLNPYILKILGLLLPAEILGYIRAVTPNDLGKVGPVFTTITLIIILFEGGLGLRMEVLGKSLHQSMLLTVISFIISVLLVGYAGNILLGLDPILALMLGATVGGTSSAVVIPLIKNLGLSEKAGTILFIESSISDVFCIIVALTLMKAYQLGDIALLPMFSHISWSFFFSILFGLVTAISWSYLLNRVRTIQNTIFTTPAFVFMIYAVVESFEFSGAIAALVFGITLGNIEKFHLPWLKKYLEYDPVALNETERAFFREVVFLLKTFFFVYIGLSIVFKGSLSYTVGIILTLIIFILRIPLIRFSSDKSIPVNEVSIMAVMAPKGLAAAVLASIPLQRGYDGGEMIQNTTYAIVFFSILLTSVLVCLMDKTFLSKFYGWFYSGFAKPPTDSSEKPVEPSPTQE